MKKAYMTIFVIATLIAVWMIEYANAGCELVDCPPDTDYIELEDGEGICVPTCKTKKDCDKNGFCLKNKNGQYESCYYPCMDILCIAEAECVVTGKTGYCKLDHSYYH